MEVPVCLACGSSGSVLHGGLTDRLFGVGGIWMLKQCSDCECGLLWLDPAPAAAEIPRLYERYYTHDAAIVEPGFHERVQRAYAALYYGYPMAGTAVESAAAVAISTVPARRMGFDLGVMTLRYVTGGRLLDIGCGDGTFLRRMTDLGWNGEGIEPDTSASGIAEKSGMKVRTCELHSVAYPPDYFDAVTLRHVIEHVPDPVALLCECRRILKPGGKLVLTTPNASSWGHSIFGRDWRGLEPPRHLRLFTVPSILAVMRKAGMDSASWRTLACGRGIFLVSHTLRTGADPATAAKGGSFLQRRWADSMELIEWFRNVIGGGNVGEELLVSWGK